MHEELLVDDRKSEFLKRVAIKPGSDCWHWIGANAGNGRAGYGRFYHSFRRYTSAHRASYVLFKGTIPRELIVCHKCDNKRCVNPDHLFLGTFSDNSRDAFEKGILPAIPPMKGENAPHAKLTNEQVLDIAKREKSQLEYAAMYGISRATVANIWTGRNWKHILTPKC